MLKDLRLHISSVAHILFTTIYVASKVDHGMKLFSLRLTDFVFCPLVHVMQIKGLPGDGLRHGHALMPRMPLAPCPPGFCVVGVISCPDNKGLVGLLSGEQASLYPEHVKTYEERLTHLCDVGTLGVRGKLLV